jgi:alanine-glyoxylate transaminase/serine-glyoxylate transaminase/serine-pyruvate transaminase
VAGVTLPANIDAAAIQNSLLNDRDIEVAGGLGPFKGKLLRVGLMGYGSQQRLVLQLLASLETALRSQGHKIESGVGLSKALECWRTSEQNLT